MLVATGGGGGMDWGRVRGWVDVVLLSQDDKIVALAVVAVDVVVSGGGGWFGENMPLGVGRRDGEGRGGGLRRLEGRRGGGG